MREEDIMKPDVVSKKNTEDGYDEHKEKFDHLWKKAELNMILLGLNEGRNLQEIIKSIPGIRKAFEKNPCRCGCADGRLYEHRLARAGQGIIAGVEMTLKWIGNEIKKGSIKDTFEYTSHDGCGAARKVCDQLKKEGKLPIDFDADQLGIQFAKAVVAAANLEFPQVKFTYRHIKADEMAELHNERCIYLDATKKINLAAVPELPAGFIVTVAEEIDPEVTLQELNALCDIALNGHGFKERFTTQKPFWIIISAENEAEKAAQIKLASSVASQFEGRVKVSGFVI